MSNDALLSLGENTLFAALIKVAIDDARSGNLEALSWLSVYGVELAELAGYDSVSYHLRVFLANITKQIETGKLKPDYSLRYNSPEIVLEDDSRTDSIEQIKSEIAKNPRITITELCKITGRGYVFVKNHRAKLLAEKPI